MTPYKDQKTDTLYLLTNTIIPTPGAERYQIGVGSQPSDELGVVSRRHANRTDSVTEFCRKVYNLISNILPDEVKPDKTSRWARGKNDERNYRFWYSDPIGNGPISWGSSKLSYRIVLFRDEDAEEAWYASVVLYNGYRQRDTLPSQLMDELRGLDDDMEDDDRGIWVDIDSSVLNDAFAEILAETTANLIESATPIVRDFIDSAE